MNSINTAGASDNSSDNSSSIINTNQVFSKKNNSTKSEIEIVDQKIIKCINEINFLKQKIQSNLFRLQIKK